MHSTVGNKFLGGTAQPPSNTGSVLAHGTGAERLEGLHSSGYLVNSASSHSRDSKSVRKSVGSRRARRAGSKDVHGRDPPVVQREGADRVEFSVSTEIQPGAPLISARLPTRPSLSEGRPSLCGRRSRRREPRRWSRCPCPHAPRCRDRARRGARRSLHRARRRGRLQRSSSSSSWCAAASAWWGVVCAERMRRRARLASWRAASGERSRMAPICSKGTENMSWRT